MNIIRLSTLRFFVCFLLALIAAPVFAQIDQEELEKNLGPVNFINYEGPQSRIETREQIRNIGAGLGREISAGAARVGTAGRYFVIHCVSEPDGSKLNADIFGLGVDTGVDHIRNLRTIIQGYLQEAYGYTARDAALLAEYITIYNAVYRGDWDYFTDRYKNQVIENLTRERAGISIRFDEWPGRTLMLIPLGIGGLSSVDTSTISDERVIEEMRKEDDRSVEQRRDMVDLQEREAEQAEQRAQVQREAISEEEDKIAQEREQIAQERAQGGDDQELDQREQDLDQREQDLDRQREEAQQQQDFAEQKSDDAQQQRQGIAEDQQQQISDEERQARGVIGAQLANNQNFLGSLLKLDPVNSEELRRSPLDTVNIRTLTFTNGKILAIAGENKGNGAIRLIEINNSNLEMAKQGDDDIHPSSLLWVNENDLYALTVNLTDGKVYLGRFDTNLILRAKSAIEVHPNASVSIQNESLLTQRSNGSPAILDPASLAEKR